MNTKLIVTDRTYQYNACERLSLRVLKVIVTFVLNRSENLAFDTNQNATVSGYIIAI